MSLESTTFNSQASSRHPWRVGTVFEELDILYETKYIRPKEIKGESFASVNPNVFVPAIADLNTVVTL